MPFYRGGTGSHQAQKVVGQDWIVRCDHPACCLSLTVIGTGSITWIPSHVLLINKASQILISATQATIQIGRNSTPRMGLQFHLIILRQVHSFAGTSACFSFDTHRRMGRAMTGEL